MNKKKCKTCQKEKDLSNFYWNNTRSRHSSYCIPCEKERKKKQKEDRDEYKDFGII